MFSRWTINLVMAMAFVFTANAYASISLSTTRVIFNGEHKEANIIVRNGGADVLIQSWIDAGQDSTADVPFAITPALARLPGNQQQLLRILYQGHGLPTDRESVMWLNVQEVPQTAAEQNVLQLAVRQRIKVFFRPSGLNGDPRTASSELQWQVVEAAGKPVLRVRNPSAFHVSMSGITLKDNARSEQVEESTMIAPMSQLDMPLPTFKGNKSAELRFQSINDYGGQNLYIAQLEQGRDITAKVVPQH